jgi:hypothetical protein
MKGPDRHVVEGVAAPELRHRPGLERPLRQPERFRFARAAGSEIVHPVLHHHRHRYASVSHQPDGDVRLPADGKLRRRDRELHESDRRVGREPHQA